METVRARLRIVELSLPAAPEETDTKESLRQAAAPHPVILGALARLIRERSRPGLP